MPSLTNIFTDIPPNVENIGPLVNQFKVKNICCIGAGYVGGPTAAVIALQNPHIRVTVVDKDPAKIRKWNSKHLPVHEPGLYDVVRAGRDGTRHTHLSGDATRPNQVEWPARRANLFFSTDVRYHISEADIIFLGVNTPTKLHGIGAGSATNLSALEGATREVALAAKPGAIIVEKSTVPCRTAQILRDIFETYRPGVPFEILSNPEFLAEGTAIKNLMKPDRILIGSAQTPEGFAAAEALKAVYQRWIDPSRILTVNLWSSELSKLVSNAMLAQRISSINTISAICERTGADIDEVATAVGRDQRVGSKFLKSGIGFGGSCFKKDILSLIYLAECLELPEVGEYWMQVIKINELQRTSFVRRVVLKLNNNLMGKKVAILGYAFKKDTNDTRESPAIDVISSLLAERPAEIAVFDPHCHPQDIRDELARLLGPAGAEAIKPQGPVKVHNNGYDCCANADAAVIVTDWDQFRWPPVKRDSAFPECAHPAECNLVQPNISTLDILTHREYKKELIADYVTVSGTASPTSSDYFFELELQCADDCRDCERVGQVEVKNTESLDWVRIAERMRKPKWVFDGRGIVDVNQMEQLGFRVETIGKASTRSGLTESRAGSPVTPTSRFF